ncbi:MAG: CocE/NonD family hydrolase [Labilibaculum sp.]|nr:CocE/NonD family hydrolase [Labilibaculum sp.]MBI9056760.1 CocE/NonD family hydrolase [Labilibaculum sp.]
MSGIKEKGIMKKLIASMFLVLLNLAGIGQELIFEKVELSDSTGLAMKMQKLAIDYLQQSQIKDLEIEANDSYVIEILAGQYEASIEAMESLRGNIENQKKHQPYIQYEIFSKAKIRQLSSGIDFRAAFRSVFKEYLISCNDELAYSATTIFTTYDAVARYTKRFETIYKNTSNTSLNLDQAQDLLQSYFLYQVNTLTEPIVFKEIKQDEHRRYIINEELIVSPRDGAEISVITARKRNSGPMSAVLDFTIYTDESNANHAILAASKGYAGVVANSRGKRKSKNAIEPLKHEYKDVYAVIDWISKQEWNNAKIGMYGGSYDGFSQWASMKEKVHPALKTIIPLVSIAPGIDYPMENNVFFNFPYKWIPYVTNNKFLDKAANFDRQKWNDLEIKWFESGKAFNEMDRIEGTPRPLFQEWISHPTYDTYWQAMIPYKDEFAHIDIPILSITGYYDGSQRGALYYYSEHLKYKPDAEHYLLIGPYDHWGAQFSSSANLRGYQIDDVAHINIRQELAYDWFDYILKDGEKPAILKDKVNFQVMGANKWINKPSLSEISNDSLVYYLGKNKIDNDYELVSEKPNGSNSITLNVDFANRTKMNNADYYPWPIIKDSLNFHDGLVFISEPFPKGMIINGSFTGELLLESNKKDFDFSLTLYELTPENKYFHLSYYIGRASYAKSREYRDLLIPNRSTKITFDDTRITSKKISKNSKIVVVINGNKNSYGQINYGTGRDVSSESITDATIPLKLKINTRSKITLPIWREK